MIVDAATAFALARMYVKVSVDKSALAASRSAAFSSLRLSAVEELSRKAGEEVSPGLRLHVADLIFAPLPDEADGEREVWLCRWAPDPALAVFVGGPRDGMLLAVPNLVPVIQLQALPSAALARRDPYRAEVLPFSTLLYYLEGYDLEKRRHVYRFDALQSN